jgi:hypothetical protein
VDNNNCNVDLVSDQQQANEKGQTKKRCPSPQQHAPPKVSISSKPGIVPAQVVEELKLENQEADASFQQDVGTQDYPIELIDEPKMEHTPFKSQTPQELPERQAESLQDVTRSQLFTIQQQLPPVHLSWQDQCQQ